MPSLMLSRQTLNRLNRAVDAAATPASKGIKAAILTKAAELAVDGLVPGDRVAELRDYTIQQMDDIGMAGAELTAAAGAEFYDAMRYEMTGQRNFVAEAVVESLHVANNRAVRGMIRRVVKTGKADVFAEECAQRVDAQIRRAPNKVVAHNAQRDPARPRWARVPGDAETCNFCLMLASRGFVYASEETASHSHAGCNCRVIPNFGRGKKDNRAWELRVEGYDPKGLYRTWVDKGRPMDLTIAGKNVSYEEFFGDMDRRGKKRLGPKGTVREQHERELKEKAEGTKVDRGANYQAFIAQLNAAKNAEELLTVAAAIERDLDKLPKQFVPMLRRKLSAMGAAHGIADSRWSRIK